MRKKIKEKAERKAQKILKAKLRERDVLDGLHSVSHRYETSTSNKSLDPSSLSFSSVPMGKVPKFNGEDYARWSDDMKVYLHGLHPSLWTIVTIGVDKSAPPSREQEYDIFRNSQAVTVLRSALSSYEYNKIRGINSAKELWDTLQMAHEGSDEVKEGKVDLLQGELEAFVMKKDETLQEMYDRLKLLVTEIRMLGSNDWGENKVTKSCLGPMHPRTQCLPQ
ncbi:Pectinesterase [Gossypium australe]|uniref:Pectinesterase n=1 Tax=Gossypium australe TaxID=47621 RepID=A0A5B6TEN3_9ROSI|nr:Pectinesterase [Gossypium australe]